MQILSGSLTKEKLEAINKRHLEVSRLITPREYIEKDDWRRDRNGNPIEYPATNYMRSVCRTYYGVPGWLILNSREIYNHNDKLVAITVHGQLVWLEEEITYAGDMVASHQVQYKKNSEEILDLGNDTKAANTDCWKKALNFHLNICDDIYRWEDPLVTKSELEELKDLANKLDNKNPEKEKILLKIDTPYYVNNANFKISKEYIETLIERKNKK